MMAQETEHSTNNQKYSRTDQILGTVAAIGSFAVLPLGFGIGASILEAKLSAKPEATPLEQKLKTNSVPLPNADTWLK